MLPGRWFWSNVGLGTKDSLRLLLKHLYQGLIVSSLEQPSEIKGNHSADSQEPGLQIGMDIANTIYVIYHI